MRFYIEQIDGRWFIVDGHTGKYEGEGFVDPGIARLKARILNKRFLFKKRKHYDQRRN